MILLIAILLGSLAGLIRAWVRHETIKAFPLRAIWLVFAAYLPQYLCTSLPYTRELISPTWVPFILLGSQTLLLAFVWLNRKFAGIWAMALGLFSNFLVMLLNHGFMPLTPENAQKLIAPGVQVSLQIGERIEFGKDILLPKATTKLWVLSDIFLTPQWMNSRAAFSIGDIFISVGAFLFLWSLGDSQKYQSMEVKNTEEINSKIIRT